MMKVMYLICLERIIDSGIFETQVKNLLFSLKKKFGSKLDVTLVSVSPVLHIHRKGMDFNFVKYKTQMRDLKQEFAKNGVKLRLIPAFRLRWGIHLNIFTLPLFLLTTLPLLLIDTYKEKYDIIHCRSYVPSLAAFIIRKFRKKIRIVFDMKGLYPEEGLLLKQRAQRSISFEFWKHIEQKLLCECNKVIVVSEPFAEYILSIDGKADVEIIPTSVNLDNFSFNKELKRHMREEYKLNDRRILIYNGSLGTWHDPKALASLFVKIKEGMDNSHLMIISTFNRERLEHILTSCRLKDVDDFTILALKPKDVYPYLLMGDYGVLPLVKLDERNIARRRIAATMTSVKVSEYLACGLPIIANERIGGVARLIEEHDIGSTFSLEEMDELGHKLDCLERRYDELQKNCVKLAERYFGVERHASFYFRIYEELVGLGH